MKIVLFGLAIISAISAAPIDDTSEKLTLESSSIMRALLEQNKPMAEWINFFSALVQSKYSLSVTCINQELKVPVNSNKLLKFSQMGSLFGVVLLRCQNGVTEMEAYNEKIKSISDLVSSEEPNTTHDCYKRELKKIEPISKLVENFDENNMNKTQEECDKIVASLEKSLPQVEKILNILEGSTCESVNPEIIMILLYKIYILGHLKDEELKKSEIENLAKVIKKRYDYVFDCFMNTL